MRCPCKRVALFLSFVSWAFSLGIANSRCWRVWEFDSTVIPFMHIGLWETYFVQRFNVSDHVLDIPMYVMFNNTWEIPDELYYGQDLILLANFMTPITLYFGSLGVWVRWINAPHPEFIQICYNISALFLFLSCFFISLTLSWNFITDLYGKTTLDFPASFPVGAEMVKAKHISYVLPLGITSACLKLVSALIFCSEWYSN